jgi:hypothetical protein
MDALRITESQYTHSNSGMSSDSEKHWRVPLLNCSVASKRSQVNVASRDGRITYFVVPLL